MNRYKQAWWSWWSYQILSWDLIILIHCWSERKFSVPPIPPPAAANKVVAELCATSRSALSRSSWKLDRVSSKAVKFSHVTCEDFEVWTCEEERSTRFDTAVIPSNETSRACTFLRSATQTNTANTKTRKGSEDVWRKQRSVTHTNVGSGWLCSPSCPRVVAKVDAGLKAKKPTSSRKVPRSGTTGTTRKVWCVPCWRL